MADGDFVDSYSYQDVHPHVLDDSKREEDFKLIYLVW